MLLISDGSNFCISSISKRTVSCTEVSSNFFFFHINDVYQLFCGVVFLCGVTWLIITACWSVSVVMLGKALEFLKFPLRCCHISTIFICETCSMLFHLYHVLRSLLRCSKNGVCHSETTLGAETKHFPVVIKFSVVVAMWS